jgi:hypothetical protein
MASFCIGASTKAGRPEIVASRKDRTVVMSYGLRSW